jgi:protein TonB
VYKFTEVKMASLKNFKADLKTKYNRYIKISTILSLSILIAAFKYFPDSFDQENLIPQTQELINIEEILSTIQKPEIPPPPKQPAIIEVSPDLLSEDVILNDIDIFRNEPVGPPPPPPRPEIKDEPQIFEWSEVMPEPIGGIKAIQSKVNYTEIARRAGLEGQVIIEAVIDETGNVIDAKVFKSLGGGLDESSLLAVKETKFSPGMQRGKPVKVKMKIPIKFVLK